MFDLLFCCRFVTFVACRKGSNVVTFVVDLSHLLSIVTFVQVVTFVAATSVRNVITLAKKNDIPIEFDLS